MEFSRKCRKCGKILPGTTEYFSPNGTKSDGSKRLYARCRSCSNADSRASQAKLGAIPEHRAKRRAYDAAKKRKNRALNTEYAKRQRDKKKQDYYFKRENDPDWVTKENERKKQYAVNRWASDPDYRENEKGDQEII